MQAQETLAAVDAWDQSLSGGDSGPDDAVQPLVRHVEHDGCLLEQRVRLCDDLFIFMNIYEIIMCIYGRSNIELCVFFLSSILFVPFLICCIHRYNAKCNNSVNGLCMVNTSAMSPPILGLQKFALETLGWRNVPLVQVC